MTPLTKEQAKALTDALEEAASQCDRIAAKEPNNLHAFGYTVAGVVIRKLASYNRDGTFIEVQHD